MARTPHRAAALSTTWLTLLALAGCAGTGGNSPPSGPGPATNSPAADAVTLDALVGTTWIAEDIDQRGVVDRLQSRLEFLGAAGVAGLAGCNSYSGPASRSGAEFRLGPFATTRKACPPAVMDQESRFLDALARARTARTDHGLLYLQDGAGNAIVRLSQLQTIPGSPAGDFPEGVLRAYAWQCTDGQEILMRNLLRERAITIGLPDGEHRLEQTVSASGARYANADATIVFWTRGDTATLERRGSAVVPCRERRADSLREDARLRGVIYRALGNEPGWTLEIGPQTRLDWVTLYGAERHAFTTSTATVTSDGISYTAGQGANSIKVAIRAGRCVDDGEIAYDYTATVEFRGTAYPGCASKLADR
jgi:putative lipoprotein